MTPRESKQLVQRIFQAILEADWQTMADCYQPDARYHGPGATGAEGRDTIINLTQGYRAAFPDMGFEILHCVAEGDLVATRGRGTGTHRGELMGIAPTGKRVAVEIMYFMRVVNGKIAEEWEVFDQLDFMRQLGQIPEVE